MYPSCRAQYFLGLDWLPIYQDKLVDTHQPAGGLLFQMAKDKFIDKTAWYQQIWGDVIHLRTVASSKTIVKRMLTRLQGRG